MAGTLYGADTNFENESAYLNTKLKEAQGTGNAGLADWVNTQQKNLQSARDTYGISGTYGGNSGRQSPGEYINGAYQNKLNAQERQLKSAMEESLADLALERRNIGQYYDAARDNTYAGQMVANRNANERMLGLGINSGAIAQAALSSNNALQGNLGQLNLDEIEALAQITGHAATAREAYQDDLVSLQESLEADRLNQLLADYYRQQDYDYQKSRDAVSDARYDDETAYARSQQEAQALANYYKGQKNSY